jgi:hypothetical protein
MSRTLYLAGAAAGLVVAGALIFVLESGDDHDSTTTATTAATATAETADPSDELPATWHTTPVDARTPAQARVDQDATAAGLGELPAYSSPHAAVEEVCAQLRSPKAGYTPTKWLIYDMQFYPGMPAPYKDRLYRIGFPHLCAEHVATLDAVLGGTAPIEDGTHEIGAEIYKIVPGQWRTTGDVSDCYWERTSPAGDILDNQFATHASGQITVTIQPSDGSFTTRGCGTWELVR